MERVAVAAHLHWRDRAGDRASNLRERRWCEARFPARTAIGPAHAGCG